MTLGSLRLRKNTLVVLLALLSMQCASNPKAKQRAKRDTQKDTREPATCTPISEAELTDLLSKPAILAPLQELQELRQLKAAYEKAKENLHDCVEDHSVKQQESTDSTLTERLVELEKIFKQAKQAYDKKNKLYPERSAYQEYEAPWERIEKALEYMAQQVKDKKMERALKEVAVDMRKCMGIQATDPDKRLAQKTLERLSTMLPARYQKDFEDAAKAWELYSDCYKEPRVMSDEILDSLYGMKESAFALLYKAFAFQGAVTSGG